MTNANWIYKIQPCSLPWKLRYMCRLIQPDATDALHPYLRLSKKKKKKTIHIIKAGKRLAINCRQVHIYGIDVWWLLYNAKAVVGVLEPHWTNVVSIHPRTPSCSRTWRQPGGSRAHTAPAGKWVTTLCYIRSPQGGKAMHGASARLWESFASQLLTHSVRWAQPTFGESFTFFVVVVFFKTLSPFTSIVIVIVMNNLTGAELLNSGILHLVLPTLHPHMAAVYCCRVCVCVCVSVCVCVHRGRWVVLRTGTSDYSVMIWWHPACAHPLFMPCRRGNFGPRPWQRQIPTCCACAACARVVVCLCACLTPEKTSFPKMPAPNSLLQHGRKTGKCKTADDKNVVV